MFVKSSFLFFLFYIFMNPNAIAASDVIEFRMTCDEVERIEICKTGDGESVIVASDDDCFGSCYMVAIRVKPEAAHRYVNMVDGMEWRAHKITLNGQLVYELPDGSEYYKEYGHLVDNSSMRYFIKFPAVPGYEDVLEQAESYCPTLIVRGEENVLTKVPY